jgi:hypothetical protein
MSHLVINPKLGEKATGTMIVELFSGFGSVKRGGSDDDACSAWWEDSVFGYLSSFVDRLSGGRDPVPSRHDADIVPVSVPTTESIAAAEKRRIGVPLVVKLEVGFCLMHFAFMLNFLASSL